MSKLPYLTSDLPGIGGQIKQRVEDFRVVEIPLYEACGEGTHVYFRVEKCGIPTPVAVNRLAKYMGVRSGEIGVAGLMLYSDLMERVVVTTVISNSACS